MGASNTVTTVFDHWHLPAGEQHLQQWMTKVNRRVEGRLTYQYHKYEAALTLCRQRRCAADVGAHIGLWSYWMAADFERLEAFEPHPDHRYCWGINMLGRRARARLHECALGDRADVVGLQTGPSSSGDTYVVQHVDRGVRLARMDAFQFDEIDLLKIDVEGYELFVLKGAVETLTRCRPVIIVEQKPGHGAKYGIGDTDGAKWLLTQGYRQRQVIDGDFIMTPVEMT